MSTDDKTAPPPSTDNESRRVRILRELKLALVDQRVQQEGSGCNPYDSVQGTGRADRWESRRR